MNAAGRKRKEHGEIGQLGGRCNYSGEEEGQFEQEEPKEDRDVHCRAFPSIVSVPQANHDKPIA